MKNIGGGCFWLGMGHRTACKSRSFALRLVLELGQIRIIKLIQLHLNIIYNSEFE